MYFLNDLKYAKLYEKIEDYACLYKKNNPFPHLVFDNFFDATLLQSLVAHFPKPDHSWWHYNNPLEGKYAHDRLRIMPPIFKTFIHELMDKEFLDFLEQLTKIQGLVVDHHLNGSGMHQSGKGGKLDIHADFNYHPKTNLDRRLNVLVYLNETWDPLWNGNLELWDKKMIQCEASIEPIFNRMVVFSVTDDAFHGHPEPLKCPEGIYRKSIAMYYYTHGRPYYERSLPHSVLYQRRPQDPVTHEMEELREKRAQGRILV